MAAPPGARNFGGSQSTGQSTDRADLPQHQPPAHRHPVLDPRTAPRLAGAPVDPRGAPPPHDPRAVPSDPRRAQYAPPKDPRQGAAGPGPTDPRQAAPPILPSSQRMAVPPPSFVKSAVQPLKFTGHVTPHPVQAQWNAQPPPPADPRKRSASPPIQDPRFAAAGARMQDQRQAWAGQGASSAPHVAATAHGEHGAGSGNSAEDRAAKKQRTGGGGKGGITGLPVSMLQVRGVLADWKARLEALAAKQKEWTTHQDFVLQLKHGIRLTDLLHERAVLAALVPRCRLAPRLCDALLLQAWARLGSPLPQLLCEPPLQSRDATLQLLNASEVVSGFAFLSAGGGRMGPGGGADHLLQSGMVIRESPAARRADLRKWYTQWNIKYILNLAAGEEAMAGAEYPLPTVEVTAEEHAGEVLPEDGESDQRVRVLRLRMEDRDEYDVRHSTLLAQAAGFIERAWRRHKQALLRHHLHRVQAAAETSTLHNPDPATWGDELPERAPMIVIHCLGGINRSPLALVYWLARYCLDRHTNKDSPWLPVRTSVEDVWERVKAKRRQAFNQHPENPVLKGKTEWFKQLKERVIEEKSRLSDLDHHPALWVHQLLPPVRGLADRVKPEAGVNKLLMVELDCGGVPGSPISDDDPLQT